MFGKKKTPVNYPGLEEEIARLISELEGSAPNSAEYEKITERLTALDGLTNHKKTNQTVSPDAIVAAVVSILGVLLIINYEKTGAITSKAFGWIPKSKI